MRDLAEIDRTLEQLGQVPGDVAALIARVLGPDRSPQALDAALQALGVESAVIAAPRPMAPRIATPRPAAPSTPLPAAPARRESSDRPLSSHDTMEEWPPEALPAAPPAAELDSVTGDALGAPEPAPAFTFSGTPLAAAGVNYRPALSVGAESDVPPALGDPAEPPLSTRQLLDRELDPNEFPSRPPQRIETPPPAAAPVEEDDFEMLIEDEEILEIQEDDVETDESDEG